MKTASLKLTSRDLERLFHESGILERRFFPRKVPSPPPDLDAEGNFAKTQRETGPITLENPSPSIKE